MKKHRSKRAAAWAAGCLATLLMTMGAECDYDPVVDPVNGTTMTEAITDGTSGTGSNLYYSSTDHFANGNSATLNIMDGISVEDSLESYMYELNQAWD